MMRRGSPQGKGILRKKNMNATPTKRGIMKNSFNKKRGIPMNPDQK